MACILNFEHLKHENGEVGLLPRLDYDWGIARRSMGRTGDNKVIR